MFPGQPSTLSRQRIWLARSVGMVADAVQIALLPFFLEGVLSPINIALDIGVAILMVLLVGWHIAFLPGFLVENLPVADLAPSWTIAVFIATRGRAPVDESKKVLLGPVGPKPPWKRWYNGLNKPRLTPSPRTIRWIWTVLYPIILVSDGWVFLQAARGGISWCHALPFGVNLAANLAYTPLMFWFRSIQLATADVLIVLLTIPWMIITIWPVYPVVGVAQLPYLLWICIAAALQVSILLRNPRPSDVT